MHALEQKKVSLLRTCPDSGVIIYTAKYLGLQNMSCLLRSVSSYEGVICTIILSVLTNGDGSTVTVIACRKMGGEKMEEQTSCN